jgi:hypothetical protein
VDALAALGREESDDVVAGRHAGHALARRLDHAGALVPEHRGRVAGGIGAARGVEVRVADAAGREAHQHLAGSRCVQLDVLDDERLGELLEHGGADLHRGGP